MPDLEHLGALEEQLRYQRKAIELPDAYYRGDHRLAFATQKYKEAFGHLFGEFADNWCKQVVNVAVDRLKIVGFRTGGTDAVADPEVWRAWQLNNLDGGSKMLHREAIKLGKAYTLVDPSGRVTVEHPSQVYVEHSNGDRTQRRSAIKKWWGDDGYVYANVYYPDHVDKYRAKDKIPEGESVAAWLSKWESHSMDEKWDFVEEVRNSLQVVSMIPFYNRVEMMVDGSSDLDEAIPLQDAINKLVLDMMVTAEFHAFPQRVLSGVEVPTDDNGQPLESAELKALQSRLWVFASETAKATQFSAADLMNYVKPIALLIQHLAAQTRTPPHYLLAEVANVSGDALKTAEAGLVSRCEDKIDDFSDPWEETTRLKYVALGKADLVGPDSEVIWADVEKKGEAETLDAATKLAALAVPREIVWQRAGLSPQEIERANAADPEGAGKPLPMSASLAQSLNGASRAHGGGGVGDPHPAPANTQPDGLPAVA